MAQAQTAKSAEYLQRPYGRVVIPEGDGTFRAEIIEFPGCIAIGDTSAEALANLEDVAASWLEVVIAKGQRVPEPIENVGFSGKLVVRLPKSLHKKAANMAAREGVSLNQFIVSSIAEQVGTQSVPIHFGPLQAFAGTQTVIGMGGLSGYVGNFGVGQFLSLTFPTRFGQQLIASTSASGGFGLSSAGNVSRIENAGS
jgi:antitoxin HicB